MIGLREAGLDTIAPNMDCWEESLWPVVVPGKHKFLGRKFWIDSILMSLEVFKKGHVGTIYHYYFRAQAWQTGCDWRRLVDQCQCENCMEYNIR